MWTAPLATLLILGEKKAFERCKDWSWGSSGANVWRSARTSALGSWMELGSEQLSRGKELDGLAVHVRRVHRPPRVFAVFAVEPYVRPAQVCARVDSPLVGQ